MQFDQSIIDRDRALQLLCQSSISDEMSQQRGDSGKRRGNFTDIDRKRDHDTGRRYASTTQKTEENATARRAGKNAIAIAGATRTRERRFKEGWLRPLPLSASGNWDIHSVQAVASAAGVVNVAALLVLGPKLGALMM